LTHISMLALKHLSMVNQSTKKALWWSISMVWLNL
jgi:hypothetical protein